MRTPKNYADLFASSRRGNFPLLRTYSGTDDFIALAEMYLETIHLAWCAIPLFWFNQMDGRGPWDLEGSIREHQKVMDWYGKRNVPVELNEPHHWGMRDAPDVIFGEAFSGEGADELFGGYAYLQELDLQDLPQELADITERLHNTALQRVDRCASAHGLIVHVPLLDMRVVEFSKKIPPELKIKDGKEKWILRQSVIGMLPDEIVFRKKAKFWEGTGISDLLGCYARDNISDSDFLLERNLPNGWVLNSKEELMYYRIFREQFGDFENLDWMGRTKGAPRD